MDLKLAQQTFHYDVALGTPAFISSVPSISCQSTATCVNTLKTFGIIDPRLVPVCDTAAGNCAADVKLSIVYPVDVSQDPAFTSGFAQAQADSIRDIKLTYGITNGVNVDIDTIQVYLGPKGSTSPTGPGVNFLGTVGPIPKLATIPDGENYLLIPDGTPAHDQYVDYTKHPENPFVVLMVVSTHLKAGDPIPKGPIDVRLVPVVTLLKR